MEDICNRNATQFTKHWSFAVTWLPAGLLVAATSLALAEKWYAAQAALGAASSRLVGENALKDNVVNDVRAADLLFILSVVIAGTGVIFWSLGLCWHGRSKLPQIIAALLAILYLSVIFLFI